MTSEQPFVQGSIIAGLTLQQPAPQESTEDFLRKVRAKLKEDPSYYVDHTGDDRTRCCSGIVCTCRNGSYDPTGD